MTRVAATPFLSQEHLCGKLTYWTPPAQGALATGHISDSYLEECDESLDVGL